MSKVQKIIIAVLSAVAMLVLIILSGLIVFLLSQSSLSRPEPAAAAAVQQQSPAAPTPTSTAMATATSVPPTATPAPTQPAEPTPTSTRVVTSTVFPTATSTPVNCINNVTNFETSGRITNEQVVLYLSQTIPATHLDHCRIIEYQPREVGLHATPVSGSFTPMFRQIYVYATGRDTQTVADILGTLTHEVGHNVHYNLRRDNWDMARRWTELFQASKDLFAREGRGFVSDYARFNDFEDFAETYRVYILDPDMLRHLNADKYVFMRDIVFDGQEY